MSYFDDIVKHYNFDIISSDKISCPFHEEDTASLVIDFEKDIYHCFGCDAGGDAVDFVAKIEKTNRLQAVSKISTMSSGVSCLNKTFMFKKFIETNITTTEYIEFARNEFQKFIKPDWNYPNYLKGRGFKAKTLDKFNVRMDADSDYKIIIPLYENGKFRGFVRRRVDSGPNKYLNNKGFKRGNFLIGNYGYGVIFVTEGILDYLKAFQYGVRNICCLLGCKASSTHIFILKKYCKEVIAALDNDERGGEGIDYLNKFFKVKRFAYPQGIKDICEMTEKQFVESIKKTL